MPTISTMETPAGPTLDPAGTNVVVTGCPVTHGRSVPAPSTTEPTPSTTAPARSRADRVARAVLRIPERRPGVSERDAHTAFQRSMTVSALRCSLTYVVFPILLPLIGLGVGVGPAIGIAIGVTAIVCDVFAIRRFFAVDHRRRWPFAALISAVVVLLVVLLVDDVSRLA